MKNIMNKKERIIGLIFVVVLVIGAVYYYNSKSLPYEKEVTIIKTEDILTDHPATLVVEANKDNAEFIIYYNEDQGYITVDESIDLYVEKSDGLHHVQPTLVVDSMPTKIKAGSDANGVVIDWYDYLNISLPKGKYTAAIHYDRYYNDECVENAIAITEFEI